MNKSIYAIISLMMFLLSCSKVVDNINLIAPSTPTKSKLAMDQFELDHAMVKGTSSNLQQASNHFPIQIINEQVIKKNTSNAEANYGSFQLTSVRNAEENLKISVATDLEISNETGKNFISFEGKKYTLAQIHFHRDGEHAIQGAKGAMEAHLVHVSTDGSILVSAVILQLGQNISPIKTLLELSPKKPEVTTVSQNFDLATVIPTLTSGYFSYSNNAGTSQHIPSIKWIVYKKSLQISQKEINQYATIYTEENSRPLQTNNNVVVYEGN
jgi:carbonic anhydrase